MDNFIHENNSDSPLKIEVQSQTDTDVNNEDLRPQLIEQTNKNVFLSKTMEQKDDLIKLLVKEKNILESEKALLQKEQNAAIKEKESIVMRFAMVEKNLLDVKNQLDLADKREKKLQKDYDALNDKVKMMKEEKIRINATLDAKCQEHRNSLRDIERLRNEVSSLETKCKWNTVKLRQEMENKNVLEKELQELKNVELVPQKLELEDSNAEKMAELKASQITLKHMNSEQTEKIITLQHHIENMTKELHTTKALLTESTQKSAELENQYQKCLHDVVDLQNLVDNHVLKLAELQSKVNELEAVRAQLSIEKDSNNNHIARIAVLKKQLNEQATDISRFHQRESELLTLNQELSSLNATLQNEISLHKSKSMAISLENDSVKKHQTEYVSSISKLTEELEIERKGRSEERLVMARHLAEKNKEFEMVQKKLDQALGDLDAAKKKNLLVVKDLQREIAVLQKHSKKESGDHNSDSISNEERQMKGHAEDRTISEDVYDETEPSTSKLIERIIRLQHANNRQAEKIDFLENHSSTLVAELQKKAKIVQHYMVKEQTGLVSTTEKNKLYNGIMHAIYGNIKTTDMNMDLVLEVNKKLQSVLEDTLLKNITLKDNLDTLGLEVDRLTRQLANIKRDGR